MKGRSLPFAGHGIDRADHVRADPARLSDLSGPDARLLRLDGLIPMLGEEACLQWGRCEDAGEGAELVFLGLKDGGALFAAVPADGDADPAYTRRETWQALGHLGPEDLALYGGARSLLDWHARHRFCARCGGTTTIAKGGWQRDCTNDACAAQTFPRVDPVTIMLVEHGGRLLLGRSPRFPPGNYSALAGFVEPGESIEEAVAREVLEEAGVRVHEVRYLGSQPWPFPSQLMIACHAQAEDDALTIDETELEDARWFTEDEVRDALENGAESRSFRAPPVQAIARHMLHWWLEERR